MTKNNNEELSESLRDVAYYLETHPDIPKLFTYIGCHVYDRDELVQTARAMGSFAKVYEDDSLILKHACGAVNVEARIDRRKVCEKVVTWKCPDEGMLAEFDTLEEKKNV